MRKERDIMGKLAYSYHTFLFPFLWNDGGKLQWEDFSKVLSVGKRWEEISWEEGEIPKGQSKEEWLQDYAAFQYFTEPANNVIFNTRGDNVVRCFEYRNKETIVSNRGEYIITKGEKVYPLNINKIRLHVYDIGVAILIFELENGKHNTLEAVNEINEYGRRINMPFLVDNGGHPVCADKIEMSFDGISFETENYKETIENLGKDFDGTKESVSLNYIMSPIQKLLDGDGKDNGGYKVTSHAAHAGWKNLFIKPCVDDRMFVCCLVRDEAFSQKVKEFDMENREYRYLSDCDRRSASGEAEAETISNVLYKLCFIEKNLTCQSGKMKQRILKNSVYDRWIDYGTLYAATHHSLVGLTGDWEGLQATVIFPFLTQYVQLAILTLAQRAAILLLSGEAAVVAEGLKESENIIPEQILEIERLQAKFIKVQNQLLLFETTIQEQGVEIYKLIRNQLYIETNKQELDEQMSNLREVANISNERMERNSDKIQAENEQKLNKNITILTTVIALFAILEPLSGAIKECFFACCKIIDVFYIWTGLTFLAVAGLGCWWFFAEGRRKKRK